MGKSMIYSYVIGIGKEIKTLKKQGFKIKKDKTNYQVTFPEDKTKFWEDFIMDNLNVGYWNEYITNNKVVFLFHLQDGFHRYEINDLNNQEILELCRELSGQNFESLESMLANNKFYKKLIISVK